MLGRKKNAMSGFTRVPTNTTWPCARGLEGGEGVRRVARQLISGRDALLGTLPSMLSVAMHSHCACDKAVHVFSLSPLPLHVLPPLLWHSSRQRGFKISSVMLIISPFEPLGHCLSSFYSASVTCRSLPWLWWYWSPPSPFLTLPPPFESLRHCPPFFSWCFAASLAVASRSLNRDC